MAKKSEPWYIHAVLYVIIAILVYILVRVAIIDPTDYIQNETYFRSESQLRMDNIRQAQILWQRQNDQFTDNLDELVNYVKTDTTVNALMVGVDTLTNRSTNPFKNLTAGDFIPDSLTISPKSGMNYSMKVDTTITIDTVINRRGRIVKIDTTTVIGTLYLLECPDGYGSIGDLENQGLKNTASWE